MFRETVDQAQAEAAAFAARLRREERLESPRQDLGRHPGTGVADGDLHVFAGHHFRLACGVIGIEDLAMGLERQPAPVRHRVARVDGQVQQRRIQHAGVGLGQRQVVTEHGLHFDAGAERASKDFGQRAQQQADVDGPRLQGLAARERKQLSGEIGAAPGRAKGRLDQLRTQRILLEALFEHLQVAGNDGQQVVEVVRDASRQLPQRFEPLQLEEPLLGVLAQKHRTYRIGQCAQEAAIVAAEAAIGCRKRDQHAAAAILAGDRAQQQVRLVVGVRRAHCEGRALVLRKSLVRNPIGDGRRQPAVRARVRDSFSGTVAAGDDREFAPAPVAPKQQRGGRFEIQRCEPTGFVLDRVEILAG